MKSFHGLVHTKEAHGDEFKFIPCLVSPYSSPDPKMVKADIITVEDQGGIYKDKFDHYSRRSSAHFWIYPHEIHELPDSYKENAR